MALRHLAILLVFIAIGLSVLLKQAKQKPTQTLQDMGLTCKNKPQLCDRDFGSKLPTAAPNQITASGRWNKAPQLPNIGNENVLGFKRWVYVSFTSDKYFVAALLVKFPYLSNVFLYLVDRETREQYEYTGRLPFGIGLSEYTASSVEGCATWGEPSLLQLPFIEFCAEPGGTGGYRFRAQAPITSKMDSNRVERVTVEISVSPVVDFILAFPLGGNEDRLAFVHKLAGMPVDSTNSFVKLGDAPPVAMENAAGALDWTKGRMLYRTAWKWVSFNDAHAKVNGTHKVVFGINLSNEVYDVENEHGDAVSAENAIWLDGKMLALTGRVEITPGDHEWTIKSTRPTADEELDLKFTPWGMREDHTNYGIMVSEFIQPFGVFSGSIVVRGMSIEIASNAFGVVEDHLAYW